MVSLNTPDLPLNPLRELDISSTGISSKTMTLMFERLNENQNRLRYLNLSYNPVDDKSNNACCLTENEMLM